MATKYNLLVDVLQTLIYASVIPGLLYSLYLTDTILLGTLKLSLLTFFVIFFVIPLMFKFCYPLQRHVIFLNFINIPRNPLYATPEEYELNGTRNFYIETDDNVRLGVWHILPESLTPSEKGDDQYYKKALHSGEAVFIYCHGNSGNRAAGHRLELYKVLRKHYHVIAFDYRSYGDSTDKVPSEMGVVNDAMTVIQWVKNNTNSRVFVWGHSLGTGVSTHALALLAEKKITVDGLILESPFNNIRDEITEHPSSKIFKYLPWFKYTITDPIYNNGLRFESDVHINNVNCSILILHAEDDLVVPFKLGYKLYESASKNRLKDQGPVEIKIFPWSSNYGHKYICNAPDLSSIIGNFEERSKN